MAFVIRVNESFDAREMESVRLVVSSCFGLIFGERFAFYWKVFSNGLKLVKQRWNLCASQWSFEDFSGEETASCFLCEVCSC